MNLPQSAISFEQARELYESARFIDLWQQTRDLWQDATLPARLEIPELILAARTAHRLGNAKYYRAMLRLAHKRAPDDPSVRYYARAVRTRRGESLFDSLRELEEGTRDGFDSPDLAAGWYATYAHLLGFVRDFTSAHDAIARALETQQAEPYVLACRSNVLFFEDRWDEARETALQAWNLAPGQPYSADALTQALVAQGKEREAVDFLVQYIRDGGQSGACLEIALGIAGRLAKRMDPDECRDFVGTMQAEAVRLPGLFPLADRHTVAVGDWLRLLLAGASRDWSTLEQLVPKLDAPFHASVLESYRKNPDGARTLLKHDPVRQRHNTCLPASVATIASTAGWPADQDKISEAISFEGTADWRARDWAIEQGLTVRPFVLEPEAARTLLDLSIPFMITYQYLINAHACAVVGYDAAAGTLLVHDPSFGAITEILLDRLDELDAPLGPQCMAFLTTEQAARLKDYPLPQETEQSLRLDVLKALETQGPVAAKALIDSLPDSSSATARYLQGLARDLAGERGEAARLFSELLKEFPRSAPVQRSLLHSIEMLGDTVRHRQTLLSILTKEPLPGIEGSQKWIYPEPHLMSRYAGLLLVNADTRHEASRWIRRALMRGPLDAETYFQLGNLFLTEDRHEDALLPFRISALLESGNEVANEAYTTELFNRGRRDEAVDWLRNRAQRYAKGVGGASPWVTLVDRLEYFGLPEEALAELKRARAERPDDGNLASFAASFFAHYGEIELAEAALDATRAHGTSSFKHNAEVRYWSSRGNLPKALEHARQWLAEEPLSMMALEQVLSLTGAVEGPDAALVVAQKQHDANPHHDEIEAMLLGSLVGTSRETERKALLQRRLKRNPQDAWAWRELAVELEAEAVRESQGQREALDRFRKAVQRCVSMSPEHTATLQLRAELAYKDGRLMDALEYYLKSFEAEPSRVWPLSRAFEIATGRPEHFSRVLDRTVSALARLRSQLHMAPGLAHLVARHLGRDAALTELRRWAEHAPGDPHIAQARGELAIDRGGGIDALVPVVPELEKAVRRFPVHVGLRVTLAEAYGNTLRYQDAADQLEALLKFAPHYTPAYTMLSSVYRKLEQPEKAEQILRHAIDRNPLDANNWHQLADFLDSIGRNDEALTLLEEACRRVPENMSLWDRRLAALLDRRREDEAYSTAKELAERYPDGALAQLILARVMRSTPRHANRQQVQQQFQRAMTLNTEYWQAVEDYADFLCAQAQFTVAKEMLESRRKYFRDPVVLDAKLIEVERRAGTDNTTTSRLASLLRSRPDFAPGWQTFMAWAEQDLKWRIARETLPLMPASLNEDVSLQCDKWTILMMAGEPIQQVEEAWTKLISNFPASMEVNLRWFDLLIEQNRFDDAESVLEVYSQHEPDHPLVVARRVVLNCSRNSNASKKLALEAAYRLWQHHIDSPPAVRLAMAELERSSLLHRAVSDIVSLFEQEALVMPSALLMAAAFSPDPGALERMIDKMLVGDLTDADLRLIGTALQQLNGLQKHKLVMKFGQDHPELVARSTAIWQAVGVAPLGRGQVGSVAKLLDNWRSRSDVEMWAVAELVAAQTEIRNFQRAIRDGVEALESIEHDGSAPLVAGQVLLSCWLSCQFDAFRDEFSRFAHIMYQGGLPPTVINALDMCYTLLSVDTVAGALPLHKEILRLKRQQGLLYPERFFKAWRACLKTRLTLGQRTALFARTAGSLTIG